MIQNGAFHGEDCASKVELACYLGTLGKRAGHIGVARNDDEEEEHKITTYELTESSTFFEAAD